MSMLFRRQLLRAAPRARSFASSAGDAANPKDYTLLSRFRELGLIGPSGINTKPYQVRLADLDGDARAEFLVVNSDGTIKGYYNTGSMHTLDNNIAVNWASTADNTVATSFGVSGVGVRLVDFDGDGRADYVWVSANGALQVWLNKANQRNSAAVTSWVPQGSVGPAVLDGTNRENIVLAPDLDLLSQLILRTGLFLSTHLRVWWSAMSHQDGRRFAGCLVHGPRVYHTRSRIDALILKT